MIDKIEIRLLNISRRINTTFTIVEHSSKIGLSYIWRHIMGKIENYTHVLLKPEMARMRALSKAIGYDDYDIHRVRIAYRIPGVRQQPDIYISGR